MQSDMKKKTERSLPHIEGYKEFNLKSDVMSWKDDSRNRVVISIVKMNKQIYQVKVVEIRHMIRARQSKSCVETCT